MLHLHDISVGTGTTRQSEKYYSSLPIEFILALTYIRKSKSPHRLVGFLSEVLTLLKGELFYSNFPIRMPNTIPLLLPKNLRFMKNGSYTFDHCSLVAIIIHAIQNSKLKLSTILNWNVQRCQKVKKRTLNTHAIF